LKHELIARSREATPDEAFVSLIRDLYSEKAVPAVYSRAPLEEFGARLFNPKTDLILSHIEIDQAKGMLRREYPSFSAAASAYHAARTKAVEFQNDYQSLKRRLESGIKKRRETLHAIETDLARFADPEKWKRLGDLCLANVATARIEGGKARVVDYYDAEQREVEIELGGKATLQEAAAEYYARYRKAQRAMAALMPRAESLSAEIESMSRLLDSLTREPTLDTLKRVSMEMGKGTGSGRARDDSAIAGKRSKKKGKKGPGRRFRSSDGYEIAVGKNDQDNDAITFRLAASNDVWLHAADYPGSHVLVRNPRRGEPVPHRTILEAAELAAFYSQAKKESKAAVHYTQKKFVSRPPKAAPGLVRLSSFKTIMVEPKCGVERIEVD
jgi:predicted ribosome quality control (RQC) complex YloA/Tae2 family protein